MALKKINDKHKQAMLLYCQGMSLEQVAEQVGRSLGTLQNWFYRDKLFQVEYEKFKQEYISDITKQQKRECRRRQTKQCRLC